ncbi:MAG: TetR/AcrR family transcriptional regulator [Phototrophicaceae bacterium]
MNRYEATKQRIRQRFFEVAIDLILEQGYDAITVSEICRRADYGRSTFYLHFADKEALFWAILEHNLRVSDAQILDAIRPLASPQREWVAWKLIFESVPFQRVFYRQLNGDLSRRLRQWQREHLITTFEAQLREGIYSLLLDVPPEIGARFITGALLEVLEYWLYHPEAGDTETMARYFFTLVFRQEPSITS